MNRHERLNQLLRSLRVEADVLRDCVKAADYIDEKNLQVARGAVDNFANNLAAYAEALAE